MVKILFFSVWVYKTVPSKHTYTEHTEFSCLPIMSCLSVATWRPHILEGRTWVPCDTTAQATTPLAPSFPHPCSILCEQEIKFYVQNHLVYLCIFLYFCRECSTYFKGFFHLNTSERLIYMSLRGMNWVRLHWILRTVMKGENNHNKGIMWYIFCIERERNRVYRWVKLVHWKLLVYS